MEEFTFDSAVCKYHACKSIWNLQQERKVHEEHEHDKTVDEFVVRVVKKGKTGHLPQDFSQNFLVKSQ